MTLKLAGIFSDHMVLQRGIPIPVWGWAAAGEKITVELAGQSVSVTALADGSWRATLPPLAAGGPFVLTASGSSTVAFRDVMLGEVWVCSGQSNMQFLLSSSENHEHAVAAADYPNIRYFTVNRAARVAPRADTQGEWRRCAPETAGNASAVAYYFGREIQRAIGVPVGLIDSSWGGTIAEAWTSRDALMAEPFYRSMVEEYELELRNPEAAQRLRLSRRAAWEQQFKLKDEGNRGEALGWASPAWADGDWEEMALPALWQNLGYNYSGVFWFRKSVELPEAWAGRDLQLSLGPVDKSDATYFNGVRVGGLSFEERRDSWCTPRRYSVPGALVKAGRNVVAVRVFSHFNAGGFGGQPADMQLCLGNGSAPALPLAGAWRYQVERSFGLVPPPPSEEGLRGEGNPNSPAMLYNNMIRPLLPYAIRGVIWYQGESNAGQARRYRVLFPLLIRNWRNAWGQGEFPFLFVQLANFMARARNPGDSPWAELREAQLLTLALPNTGMAVTVDIGDALDIHPRNKRDVGRRLALAALAKTYGFKDLVHSGPLYQSARVEGPVMRVKFDHVGAGLVARGGDLRGFAVAGADRKFVWADARIDGHSVVAASPQVASPVAVRYAWANNPDGNLYNASDLPASPFRTDDWAGITA